MLWRNTQTILQALNETRRTDIEFCVKDIPFLSFRTGEKLKIDSLEIELIHVDHSVRGAYAFVVNTSQVAVLYTGDFRIHGAIPQMTQDFVEKAKEAESAEVVTEATNMTSAAISSWNEVEDKLDYIVREAGALCLWSLLTWTRQSERFLSNCQEERAVRSRFTQTSDSFERTSFRHSLSVPNLNDENILIFRKSKDVTNGKAKA